MSAVSPCRTYIAYRHALFSQGVRSILEERRTVQIVGMESDFAKALKAVRFLRPEVVIVEESTKRRQPMRLAAFLHSADASRVVTLSLDHSFATVYQRHRVAAADPADLVKAILGTGKLHSPRPNQPHPNTSIHFQPESDCDGDKSRSGRQTRVRRTRRQGTQASDKPRRASRGSRTGG
jgi:chemotaxis response regulator CheB